MDVKKIKRKANLIYQKNRKQIIPQYFYVGYVNLLAQYLQSGLFSFFVSIFLCPITHGYVKCAMKLVDEEDSTLDYRDSLIGIFEFSRVAPAYIVRKFIILFLSILVSLPIMFFTKSIIREFDVHWFSSLGNAFLQTEFFLPNFKILLSILDHPMLILDFLISGMIYLLLSTIYMPIPYVMELEEFSWVECIVYSVKLMKNHIFSFFQLYLQFFVRHSLYFMITGFMLMFIGSINEFVSLFCVVVSLFVYIELYKGRFEIAKYLFYQEIRGINHERNEENEKDCC